MYRIVFFVLALSMLCGCVSQPDFYAPPAQRKPLDETLARLEPVVEMSSPTIDQSIVQDIAKGPQTTPWRWTGKRPTVTVGLRSTSNYNFHMEFAIVDSTFKSTGPITISYYVNDQLLESVKYDSPGRKTYHKPIPMHMLTPMADNKLAAEIDKTWRENKGDPELGVILVRIGLVQ